MNVTTGRGQANPFVTGGVYGVLFLFGVVQGMLGSFLYSGMTGPLPWHLRGSLYDSPRSR